MNWQFLEPGTGKVVRRALSKLAGYAGTAALLVATFLVLDYATLAARNLPPVINAAATAASGTLECGNVWPLDGTSDNGDPVRVQAAAYAHAAQPPLCNARYVVDGVFVGYLDAAGGVSPISSVPAWVAGNSSDAGYRCAALVCYGAYCKAQGVQAWWYDHAGLGSYCRSYWVASGYADGLLVGASAVIVAVQALSLTWITFMASLERHATLSAQELSVAMKSFLAAVFNSGVVLLIVWTQIQGHPDGLLSLPFLFGGRDLDFSAAWYSDVGSAIIRTQALQSVLPHAIRLVSARAAAGVVRFRQGYQATQEGLNALCEPDVFSLAERVGEGLAHLFVTMLFSAGLPILVPFLAIYLSLGRLTDKFLLLRCSRRPPLYDETLTRVSLAVAPYAVLLHTAFAAWFFAAATRADLPNELAAPIAAIDLQGIPGGHALGGSPETGFSGQFDVRERIMKRDAFPQVCGFILTSAILLLRQSLFMQRTVGNFMMGLCCGWAARPQQPVAPPMEAPADGVPPLFAVRHAHGKPLPEDEEADASTLGFRWQGPLHYDMTRDERYAHAFADARWKRRLERSRALFRVFDSATTSAMESGSA